MASDINRVKRERLEVLKAMDQALRPVDTSIEYLQRSLKRFRTRKTKLPSIDDYTRLYDVTQEMNKQFEQYVKVLQAGYRIFRRVR